MRRTLQYLQFPAFSWVVNYSAALYGHQHGLPGHVLPALPLLGPPDLVLHATLQSVHSTQYSMSNLALARRLHPLHRLPLRLLLLGRAGGLPVLSHVLFHLLSSHLIAVCSINPK